MEIITGVERRRHWRLEDKLRMVAEAEQPGACFAEVARRHANRWLLENVGNLLRAEFPELVVSDRLTWRVEVALTSPAKGRVGWVGRLFQRSIDHHRPES